MQIYIDFTYVNLNTKLIDLNSEKVFLFSLIAKLKNLIETLQIYFFLPIERCKILTC